ncbi:MAG: hypothetical protein ACKVT0_01875, partial [Planctomycetaceae bacterium]
LPAWALVTEVPNGTSVHKVRSLDAMALGCWKSGGLEVLGFEIKVSRSDWMRELQDPSKSTVFTRYCHRFFVVAPKGVVEIGELPREWGLIVATEKTLTIKSAASLSQPDPLPLNMMAALLRRVLTVDDREQRNTEAFRLGYDDAKQRHDHYLKTATDALASLKKRVEDFERESGVAVCQNHGKMVRDRNEIIDQFAAFTRTPQRSRYEIRQVKNQLQGMKFHAEDGLERCDQLEKFLDQDSNETTALTESADG